MSSRQLLAYAQLVRLPNAFTAMADITLAALAVGAFPQNWTSFALLLFASTLLYCSGMVWNDFFDIEQDRRERSFRPIPSGRINRATAAAFGAALMLGGVVCAALLDWSAGRWTSSPVAVVLVVAVLLYDGWLKRTWAGPLAMGSCRFLNVLLGLTVAGAIPSWGWFLALVVGSYIVGVTWFARCEAKTSDQNQLAMAAAVMLSSLVLALALPVICEESGYKSVTSPLFPYLLVAFGFYIGVPVMAAVSRPTPERVQKAVKRSVLGLVLLDAILATALAGNVGLVIVVLLLPAMYLGRWVYST